MKIWPVITFLFSWFIKKWITAPRINREIRLLKEKVDALTSEKTAAMRNNRYDSVRVNQLTFDIKLLNRRINRLGNELGNK